jgi:hypothetical protein
LAIADVKTIDLVPNSQIMMIKHSNNNPFKIDALEA